MVDELACVTGALASCLNYRNHLTYFDKNVNGCYYKVHDNTFKTFAFSLCIWPEKKNVG